MLDKKREVIKKIISICEKKGQNEVVVSCDDFSYIFNEGNLKLSQQALFAVLDDLMENDKVLTYQPDTIYPNAYVMVDDKVAIKFKKNKFRKYFQLYADSDELSSDYKSGKKEISVRFKGNIYELKLGKLYQDHFNELKYDSFVKDFFKGDIAHFKLAQNFITEYIILLELFAGNFNSNISAFEKELAILLKQLEVFAEAETQFTVEDLALAVKDQVTMEDFNAYMLFVNLFVNYMVSYKDSYTTYNSIKIDEKTNDYFVATINNCKRKVEYLTKIAYGVFGRNLDADKRVFLISTKKNEIQVARSKQLLLCQFFRALGYGDYEIRTEETVDVKLNIATLEGLQKLL